MGKAPIDQRPLGVGGAGALNPDEFGTFLGLASWLMSMSKEHRDLPFSTLDSRILPAILLKQFKIIRKDTMPMAFLSWATLSDEAKAKFQKDPDSLELLDWRSGKNVVVVECISPFGPAAEIKAGFIKELIKSQTGAAPKRN
ncbi:toxin-activating lysine-acyltransferase [Algirhabdus cladophorae]|uniref:toxin-activating lysine-acyltransferase n=1 Tax=Algirhabdus cladophorae TaxID=3377108 RepID=UPI003B84ADC7